MGPALCIDTADVDRLSRTLLGAAGAIRHSKGSLSRVVERLRAEDAWQIPGWVGIEVDLGRTLATMDSLVSDFEASSRVLIRYATACDRNEQAGHAGILQEAGEFLQQSARGAGRLASYLLHSPHTDLGLGTDLAGALVGELMLDAALGAEVGGAALDVTGVGAVIGVPINVAAAGLGVAGAGIMLASGAKFGKDLSDAAKAADHQAPPAGAGDERLPIPEATRLRPTEQLTAGRLRAKLGDALQNLRESPHLGEEYIGTYNGVECTFDATGTKAASLNGDMNRVVGSIQRHLLKSVDYTVIDLTDFRPDQVQTVRDYLDTLSSTDQAKIIRIGF